MSHPRRHAAALLALAVALLPAAPALAAGEPTLVAQIEEAAPTPEAQPPLSEDPPDGLGGDDEESEEPAPEKAAPLPETGIEAGLIALLGVGLLASGGGLRLTLRRDDAV
jgi:LPXTG-motif cell wall-anchored protein